MRQILGLIIILGGWALAFYVGFVVLLYGGIIDAFDGLQQKDNSLFAWGIIKAIFFELGAVIGWIGTIIGIGVMND